MINLRETLLTEDGDLSARRGCLMAMVSKDVCEKITNFGKRLIKEEDLYLEGNEYGRENESHITIRYGFTKDLNELDVRQLLKGQNPFMVELIGLDKFTNPPQYDVAVFKVNSPVLKQLNEMTSIYPNETDFPHYDPHMTLAYIKKGRFPHSLHEINLRMLIDTVCYSPIQGDKAYYNLND